MFHPTDPRAKLATGAPAKASPVSAYAGADYARFYAQEPQEAGPDARTWIARGQNFIVAYSEVRAGANALCREPAPLAGTTADMVPAQSGVCRRLRDSAARGHREHCAAGPQYGHIAPSSPCLLDSLRGTSRGHWIGSR